MKEKIKKEYTPKERNDIGRRAGAVGIGVNLILFTAKLVAGILSGSVSIIADAINNLTDAASSVIVIVGYFFAGKPADKKHPYGHARSEYLSTLFISIIVTVLGVELFRSSISSIAGGETAEYGVLSVAIMIASIAVKGFLAVFYRVTGKKISSASLAASAADSIGDIAATGAVLLGMVLSPTTGRATDGVLGCIIAAYIFIMGLKMTKEASDTLLGKAPDRTLVFSVIEKIRSYDGVLGIHDLVLHNYGEGRFFASVHLEMDAERDIMESHDIIDNIENDFAHDMGIRLVIHLDPVYTNDERLNSLKSSVREIIDEISSELSTPISMHDFRAVFGITHTNLIFDIVVENELPVAEDEIIGLIRGRIKKLDETYCAVITMDRDYTSTVFG